MITKDKIIKKIDSFLTKKTHKNFCSVLLDEYSDNIIYIRFDYVDKVKAYKVTWFDLKYIDIKNLSHYMNSQLVSSFLANKLVSFLQKLKNKTCSFIDEKILNDRVIFTNRINKDDIVTYTFDRFLPRELEELIDPLALLFSYLPRAFDSFLTEIYAIFDNNTEYFNSQRPIKFDLKKDNIDDLFSKHIITKGRNLIDNVQFLEKIKDRYTAIVKDEKIHLVIIEDVVKDFKRMWCSCENPYLDEHIYATLQCLKDNKIKPFYKVRYKNNKKNLLDEVRVGGFYCSMGIEDDNILLISKAGGILRMPFLENGKVAFEVIEDDDDLSLSKIFASYDK